MRRAGLALFGLGALFLSGCEAVYDTHGNLPDPDSVLQIQPGVDDRAPQPFHVVQQALAAGFAEHLAEQVAEQAYVPAHRRRHVLAVGVPAHPASVATVAAGTRQRRPLS